MKPILSLCIPTYNRAPLLREALEHIWAQWDDGFEERIEIIVSDNASTDETPQVLQQIAAEHASMTIRVHRSAANRGPDANIYQVVQMAQGNFVYLLSDDDLLLPGAIKKLFSLIQEFPEVDAFSLNIRSFRKDTEEIASCWFPILKDTLIRDCNQALLQLNPLFLSVFAFRNALVAGKDYSSTIGTNLLQSYIFLDVLVHGSGVVVTAEPFLAQRQENTSGWNFFRVMTTNLRDLLTHAEETGFSPITSSAFLAGHLRTQILTAILYFKLSGGAKRISPDIEGYWDGIKRLWQVYGPDPFLLFVIFPLMLIPGNLLRLTRDFYHILKPPKSIFLTATGQHERIS